MTAPLLVVTTYLRGCDDVRLGLYSSSAEQSGPMCKTCWNSEGRWIGDKLGTLTAERDRGFREAELVVQEALSVDTPYKEPCHYIIIGGASLVRQNRSASQHSRSRSGTEEQYLSLFPRCCSLSTPARQVCPRRKGAVSGTDALSPRPHRSRPVCSSPSCHLGLARGCRH